MSSGTHPLPPPQPLLNSPPQRPPSMSLELLVPPKLTSDPSRDVPVTPKPIMNPPRTSLSPPKPITDSPRPSLCPLNPSWTSRTFLTPPPQDLRGVPPGSRTVFWGASGGRLRYPLDERGGDILGCTWGLEGFPQGSWGGYLAGRVPRGWFYGCSQDLRGLLPGILEAYFWVLLGVGPVP